MKIKLTILFLTLSVVIWEGKCQVMVKNNFELAEKQYRNMLDKAMDINCFPRTVKQGRLWCVSAEDWTSGFWPGALWYLYEYTKNNSWKDEAMKWTDSLKNIQYFVGHHDVGFMMYCSYGNGFRLTANPEYIPILVQSARSLCKRYSYNVGCIQSWDARMSVGGKNNWKFPVIIDNMMNLELLFWATQATNDSVYWNIAVSHAEKTMKNQIRPDFSCYHVVNYDPDTGDVLHRQTAQGFADNSTWARGQAWGVYSFTMVYRYTKDERFLRTAINMADFFLNHKNLPDDGIPYWDFNVGEEGFNPDFKYNPFDYRRIPRDVSAACVVASALFELCGYVSKIDHKRIYYDAAIKILNNLSTDCYRAKENENHNFILKHSVGNFPGNNEVDVPLIYADYYFLEALVRYNKMLSSDLFLTKSGVVNN
ncbi:glycoside hydrolase family 88 protein [Bacteroides ovatus]|jgi:unsaturated chondroitin disaccharide hydrolase|uniref:Chondroitin AC lyase n=1 Tax=Bacteroides ovatus TaxID=28116 RepID=A0A1G6G7Q6_BACOV|nr:glycoside hydrolase family 88 protein [Bacteroides ovatus]SDB78028.1 chondroitin AC lyase [Bacteroides ovatus]SDH85872.1 chondroitin AC lyase [Bacteroides ovatus]